VIDLDVCLSISTMIRIFFFLFFFFFLLLLLLLLLFFFFFVLLCRFDLILPANGPSVQKEASGLNGFQNLDESLIEYLLSGGLDRIERYRWLSAVTKEILQGGWQGR
jgi:hypothetical protein